MKYWPSCLWMTAITLSASLSLFAQPAWLPIREEQIAFEPANRLIVPKVYRLYRLDFVQMQTYLRAAPSEQDYVDGAPGLLLNMPLANGELVRFEVWEAPVMHPDLGAAFPDIRSFAGKSVSRKGLTARFDVTPAGFHAMIFNPGGSTVFIDPFARGNTHDYLCYFRKDFVKKDGFRWECHVAEEAVAIELPSGIQSRAGDCGNRREYRLALACTGEYANYHGAYGSNKAPALAAMVTTMTRVNGVFERDCGLRMVLIPNDTAIIFTDPASDPYTNNSGSTMLNQNKIRLPAIASSVQPTTTLGMYSALAAVVWRCSIVPAMLPIRPKALQAYPTRWAVLSTLTMWPMKWATSTAPSIRSTTTATAPMPLLWNRVVPPPSWAMQVFVHRMFRITATITSMRAACSKSVVSLPAIATATPAQHW